MIAWDNVMSDTPSSGLQAKFHLSGSFDIDEARMGVKAAPTDSRNCHWHALLLYM